jgi:UDP-N-acetylglucosamine pyrophosphorylase
VDLAVQLAPARTIVVVGWQKDSVVDYLAGKPVICVEQSPQLGTGHAVMQAQKELDGFRGDILVLSGDAPHLSYATTRNLIVQHQLRDAAATVLTAMLDDPTGYGRILRNGEGNVVGIIEHKDASEEQRLLKEINSGIYVFDQDRLFEGLKHIKPLNVQKEYYLTDVFEYFWRNRLPVNAVVARGAREIMGVNTPEQLEEARAFMEHRQ